MTFEIIQITDNVALNTFFTFPIYVMLISLVPISILQLIKKI